MPGVIKVVKTFGIGAILLIAIPYLLLYFNLSDKQKSLYETSSSEPTRLALTSKKAVDVITAATQTQNNLTDLKHVDVSIASTKVSKSTTKDDGKKQKKKKKKRKRLNILKEIKLQSQFSVNRDLRKEYDLNNLSSAANCSFWNDTVMPPYTRLCKQKNADKQTLIALFTTMHYGTKNLNILDNTLRLWSELGPKVKRILFVSSPQVERHLVRIACNADWEVMTAPLCDKNKLPVLKSMFLAAQQIHHSDFFGFANGDILFDESLLETLQFIKDNYLKNFKKTLFVGRRTNIKMQHNQTIANLDELRTLAKNGTDGYVIAIDYFISHKNGFDWEDIPKVVVARIAYDNWMIRHALQKKFAVFDLTNTTLSAHQSTGKYYSSHHKKDAGINNAIVGPFDFTRGLISCAQLKTKLEDGKIRLKKRIKYGMCGVGSWSKRKISKYGHEIEAEYEPGMKL